MWYWGSIFLQYNTYFAVTDHINGHEQDVFTAPRLTNTPYMDVTTLPSPCQGWRAHSRWAGAWGCAPSCPTAVPAAGSTTCDPWAQSWSHCGPRAGCQPSPVSNNHVTLNKSKDKFVYSAVSSPQERFTLYFPDRPVHSDTISSSPGSIQPYATINAQRLLVHISTTVYSQVLIYTAEWTGAM